MLSITLFSAGNLKADLAFNLDFQGNGNNGTHSGAGATGSAGDVWNGIGVGFNPNGNVEISGAAVDVGVFVDNATLGFNSGTFAFGSDSLGEDYVFSGDNSQSPQTLADGTLVDSATRLTVFTEGASISGLDVNSTYDFYLIGHGNEDDQISNFLLTQANGTFLNGTQTGQQFNGTYVEGANFTKFSNVSPTVSGNFTEFEIFLYSADGGSGFGAINGLQLVEVENVPEPTSLGLMGCLALTALVGRRRT